MLLVVLASHQGPLGFGKELVFLFLEWSVTNSHRPPCSSRQLRLRALTLYPVLFIAQVLNESLQPISLMKFLVLSVSPPRLIRSSMPPRHWIYREAKPAGEVCRWIQLYFKGFLFNRHHNETNLQWKPGEVKPTLVRSQKHHSGNCPLPYSRNFCFWHFNFLTTRLVKGGASRVHG